MLDVSEALSKIFQLEGPFIDTVHQGRKGQIWLDDIVELIGDDGDQVLLRGWILIVGSVKRQGFIQTLCLLLHGLRHEEEQLI